MPSSVDLPPPAAANTPTRWPTPSVSIVSIARTPVGSAALISARSIGPGAGAWSGRRGRSAGSSPSPSIGRPRPSSTRPSSAGPQGTRSSPPRTITSASTDSPRTSPSGVRIVACPAMPTTSTGTVSPVAGSMISQVSPMRAAMPVTLMVVPRISATRPRRSTVLVRARLSSRRSSEATSPSGAAATSRSLTTTPTRAR